MKPSSRSKTFFAVIVALLLILLIPLSSHAQTDRYWIGPYYGNWNAAEHWIDNNGNPGVPKPGDSVFIPWLLPNYYTVNYDAHYGPDSRLRYLEIDLSSTLLLPSDAETLAVGSGPSDGRGIVIGNWGTGILTQEGGIVNISGSYGALNLGNNPGSVGTYQLIGGTLILGSFEEYIGNQGQGVFIQNGGTHEITGMMYLGVQKTGSGYYRIEGGTLKAGTSGGGIVIGTRGVGYFVQNAGTVEVNNLILGGDSGATGEYYLYGGDLRTNYLEVGQKGSGTFGQSGGTVKVNDLILGRDSGATGEYYQYGGDLTTDYLKVGNLGYGYYNLSDTGSLVVNKNLTIGVGTNGYGVVTQDGGSVSINGGYGALILGRDKGTFGGYYLNSGNLTLVGFEEYIGDQGSGEFIQTGGTHEITGMMYLGVQKTGSGYYGIEGGTLKAGTSGGGIVIGARGVGYFYQALDGRVEVNNLILGGDSGATGEYYLYGGNLTTDYLVVGRKGSGTFEQSAGTNIIKYDLNLGERGGGLGTYNLTGGELAVGGAVRVGVWGTGSFTQNNSSTHTISGHLVLANDADENIKSYGTYDLKGGTLSVGESAIIGMNGTGIFNQSGGTHNITYDLNLGQIGGSSGTYNLNNSVNGGPNDGVLNVGRNLHIGLGGTGVFNHGGGPVTVGSHLVLGTSYDGSLGVGTYNLYGGELTVKGNAFIGFYSEGTFNQTGGTNTIIGSPSEGTGTLYLGVEKGGFGKYKISDGELTTNFIQIGGSGTGKFIQTGGTVNVIKYSDSSGGGINLGQVEGSKGKYILKGGEVNTHDLLVGASGTGIFTQKGGTVKVAGGVVLSGDDSRTGVGIYNLKGGELQSAQLIVGAWGEGTFNQSGGDNQTGGIIISGNPPGSKGTYNMSGGTLTVNGNILIREGGTFNFTGGEVKTNLLSNYGLFTGSGGSFIGNFENYGTLNPGTSPGILKITGDYIQGDSGILLIELAGYDKGTGYDFLNITGMAKLGGTLDIDLLEGFDPVVCSFFTILHAKEGVSGRFAFLDLPALGGGRGWEIIYGSNDVQVHVTPIPSSILLLGTGLLGIVGLMRRRKK